MSTNLNYKQVANVSRRTWDTETYEKKAKARQEAVDEQHQHNPPGAARKHHRSPHDQTNEAAILPASNITGDLDEELNKPEFRPAEQGAAGPEGSKRAFLQARTSKVDLESKVGTSEIIAPETAVTIRTSDNKLKEPLSRDDGVYKSGVGWHCRVCDCFLKDSHTYLDHINGRKHQRKLGYSMRVERTSKDQLLQKLNQLSQKKAEQEQQRDGDDPAALDLNEVVRLKDEEAQKRKEERQRKRQERKKRLTEQEKQVEDDQEGGTDDVDEGDEEEEVKAEVDPAMAAMMGFAGFGGGNKNR